MDLVLEIALLVIKASWRSLSISKLSSSLFILIIIIIIIIKPTTVNSRFTDTPIIRTAAKSQAKINWRCLTEINSRYYGLSPMRTLTEDLYSVRNKGTVLKRVRCTVHRIVISTEHLALLTAVFWFCWLVLQFRERNSFISLVSKPIITFY